MSSDRGLLAGLEVSTNAELRYFELVGLRHHGLTEDQPVYLCIGKHAFFCVLPNLAGLYLGDGGKVYYAHVEQLVEDTETMTDLLILLTANRPQEWESERLFIHCHHRLRLAENLAVAWQTDRTYRLGGVVALPWSHFKMRNEEAVGLHVEPFQGWSKKAYQGYNFFVHQTYQEQPPSLRTARAATFLEDQFGAELTIQVEEPEVLTHVREAGREHIRWVAMERKHSVLQPLQHAYVLKNQFYIKRMNLASDCASWTAWEYLFRAENGVTAVVMLRREYLPPVLDLCQDIIITLHVPASVLDNQELTTFDILNEAHIIADSVSPVCADCTASAPLYFNFIQAKLNALHFDEDAMSWIHARLLLEPVHRTEAMCFLKAVLRLLQDENALNNPSLLDELDDVELLELMIVPKRLAAWAEREFPNLDVCSRHAWNARVARYLAYQLDGVAFSYRFTLVDLVTPHFITEYGQRAVANIVYYLLHIRPVDMSEPFKEMTLPMLAEETDPNSFTFNDRVMQGLIECGWVAKTFARNERRRDRNRASGMTVEYAKLLSQLLLNQTASRNLKAAICRQIISANEGSIPTGMLIPALVELMERGSLFLQTYATVTLINLTGGQPEAKALLMNFDAARICIDQLATKDDDLLYYTMVLLTNITKTEHHRDLVKGKGAVPVLMHLLVGYYHDIQYKSRLLTELCSVIGQLCNDEDTRLLVTATGETTIDCLLHMLQQATSQAWNTSKLKSKAMFALRQACVASDAVKEAVGRECIKFAVEELKALARFGNRNERDSRQVAKPPNVPQGRSLSRERKPHAARHDHHHSREASSLVVSDADAATLDCATNALMLLLVLSTVAQNTGMMRREEIEPVLDDLLAMEFTETSSTRERLQQLKQQVTGAVKTVGSTSFGKHNKDRRGDARRGERSGVSESQSAARMRRSFLSKPEGDDGVVYSG
mmetsp:Transcript_32551/g.74374  ORF Transcript_32551/g.74374 Transcript_32551/m.74374 type:complete len:947 (+) Transcript_32551:200-3040(+)